MGKERTEKSKYKSRYSPDKFISGPQLITEIILEKLAANQGKELPLQYWGIPEWGKLYRNQIASANKLVKEYGEEAVLKALRDKRCKKTYSLRSPWLLKVIVEIHTKAELHKQLHPVEERQFDEDTTNQKPVQRTSKNILDTLEELD